MKKFFQPARLVILFILLALLLSVYGSTLYDLQIVKGAEYLEASKSNVVTEHTVTASRGDILDRNGSVLISSVPVYNITVTRLQLLTTEDPNGTLLGLINAAEKAGVEYNDSFPVTKTPTFSYIDDMSDSQRSTLDFYLEYFSLDKNISTSDLIVWMKDHYGIDYTTDLPDARKVIGIRYELELRVINNMSDYIFAEDVDTDFISVIEEQNFAGVNIQVSSRREYHTEYAAHLLGYTGLMTAEEYEQYSEDGYPMDAVVGKDGVELAFEKYLHGQDGVERVTTTSGGATTGILTKKEAQAGSNVYLTIDIGLQAAAEAALADTIDTLNASRKENQDKATGGAIVAIDPNSGELLACASYPTYDISTLLDNYEEISQDSSNPLFNRATMGTYSPGSTFKMVTAYAALSTGKIGRWTTITDEGIYTKYKDYQPRCWIYPNNHGTLTVVGALENSCNYFFYSVGDEMGIDTITKTAELFGFGSPTGVEIPEVSGVVSSADYKRAAIGEDWWAGDTLQSAIGQGYHQFTPIQIAAYTASIANGGTLYNTTLLNRVMSHDYQTVEYDNSPTVKNTIDNSEGYIDVLKEGMEAVVDSGSASAVFSNYKVDVAAKTGTVQSSTSSINTGVFVCYAPADDPEIAIAVVVEHGGSGSAITTAAKAVLDYYFAEPVSTDPVTENTILR